MHLMLAQRVGRHGAERSNPNVQRDLSDIDAGVDQVSNQIAGQVQTGGGGRNGSSMFCENGLIVFQIGVHHVPAADVMWQRNSSDLLQQFFGGALCVRANHPSAAIESSNQRQFETFDPVTVLHRDRFARLSLSSCLAEHFPNAARIRL